MKTILNNFFIPKITKLIMSYIGKKNIPFCTETTLKGTPCKNKSINDDTIVLCSSHIRKMFGYGEKYRISKALYIARIPIDIINMIVDYSFDECFLCGNYSPYLNICPIAKITYCIDCDHKCMNPIRKDFIDETKCDHQIHTFIMWNRGPIKIHSKYNTIVLKNHSFVNIWSLFYMGRGLIISPNRSVTITHSMNNLIVDFDDENPSLLLQA